jgi:lipoprotein NlpD
MDKKYRTLIRATSKIIVTISFGMWIEQSFAYNYAPVEDAWQQPQARQSGYRVNKDDTIYSVAWAFNIDYLDLARANNLRPPYKLHEGQYLNMNLSTVTAAKKLNNSEQQEKTAPEKQIAPRPKAITTERTISEKQIAPEQQEVPEQQIAPQQQETLEKQSTPEKVIIAEKQTQHYAHHAPATISRKPTQPRPLVNTAPNIRNSAIKWQWPVRGPLINSANNWLDEKGVNIKSNFGTPVLAAANGQVVYAGSGVKGYGKLIIIKHNDNILSAYALNQSILVNTGSNVRRGEEIATVGCSTSSVCFVHFEIRKNGLAINPRTYLRSKGA